MDPACSALMWTGSGPLLKTDINAPGKGWGEWPELAPEIGSEICETNELQYSGHT